MKCSLADCCEDATVHILEIRDRGLVGQKDLCEDHKWKESPFADPGAGITSLGGGMIGGFNTFDLCFVVFFDRRQADSLFFREVSGTKRFSIPVSRYQSCAIIQAIQKVGEEGRPFTFTAFAMILQSLGDRVEEAVVDEIEGQGEFYHTKITIQQANSLVVVDIRPSDAFGLAIACGAPIRIADSVLARAAELGWTQQPEK